MKTKEISRLLIGVYMFLSAFVNLLAQEELVSFDNKNKVFKLTPELEEKVNVYSGGGKFKDAELFKQNDSTFILEIHYTLNDKLFRERTTLTLKDITAIRNKLVGVNIAKTQVSDSMEGKGLFLASSLYAGLALFGPTLPILIEPNDAQTGVGLYMLGAGAGFFVPYLLINNKPISYGQANLAYYGYTRSIAQSLLLNYSLGSSTDAKSTYGVASLLSIGEVVGGYHLVKNLNISNGTADLMTVYGDFGFAAGAALASQLDLFHSSTSQLVTVLILAGNVGGLVAGYQLGKNNSISTGDAEIISTSGWLGVYMPVSILAEIFKNNSPKYAWEVTTPMLLIGIAGAYVGHQLVKDYDFSFTQGFVTKIGTYAGGLVGLGMTYMVYRGNDPSVFLIGSYLGAQAGFYFLYKMNIKSIKSETLSKFNFKFSPENYFLSKNLKTSNPQLQGSFPLASLTYKF